MNYKRITRRKVYLMVVLTLLLIGCAGGMVELKNDTEMNVTELHEDSSFEDTKLGFRIRRILKM